VGSYHIAGKRHFAPFLIMQLEKKRKGPPIWSGQANSCRRETASNTADCLGSPAVRVTVVQVKRSQEGYSGLSESGG
jgi:hypothetical protein